MFLAKKQVGTHTKRGKVPKNSSLAKRNAPVRRLFPRKASVHKAGRPGWCGVGSKGGSKRQGDVSTSPSRKTSKLGGRDWPNRIYQKEKVKPTESRCSK